MSGAGLLHAPDIQGGPRLLTGGVAADGPWQPPSLASVVAPWVGFRASQWNGVRCAGGWHGGGGAALRPPLRGAAEGYPSLLVGVAALPSTEGREGRQMSSTGFTGFRLLESHRHKRGRDSFAPTEAALLHGPPRPGSLHCASASRRRSDLQRPTAIGAPWPACTARARTPTLSRCGRAWLGRSPVPDGPDDR